MVATYVAELRRAVSADRLSKYQLSGSSELEIAVNYSWNMALSEALYSSLGAMEITLRNAIHHAATVRFQSEFWFDLPGILLLRQPGDVLRARDALVREHKSQSAGRIIAGLSLGFWTTLLSDPYHRSFWMPGKARMLKDVFPHMTNAQRIRSEIFDRYNGLRLLRNRVFHFEPVWYRPNLADQHQHILEAIGWISPVVRSGAEAIDHFPETYRSGRKSIEMLLRAHLELAET